MNAQSESTEPNSDRMSLEDSIVFALIAAGNLMNQTSAMMGMVGSLVLRKAESPASGASPAVPTNGTPPSGATSNASPLERLREMWANR